MTTTPGPLRLGLTASTVKGWFQYRCERKAVYEAMHPAERARLPILEEPQTKESAWAAFVKDFEAGIIDGLVRRDPANVLRPSEPDGALSLDEAYAFLRRKSLAEFACQFPAWPTESLTRELRLPPNVTIRGGRADVLIALPVGRPVFRLVDIKATQHATLFHKAQVAHYALAIRAMIAEAGIGAELDDEAEIWHIDPSAAEGYRRAPFKVRAYEEAVRDFFHRVVPNMSQRRVDAASDDTFFHVYFKCEQCQFIAHCERRIGANVSAEQRDLSAVAGMSQQAKRALSSSGICSLSELAETQPAKLRAGGSWTLQSKSDVFVARARSLVTNRVERLDGRLTWLMPQRVDSRHILVVDADPVDARLAALGYLRSGSDGREPIVRVLTTGTPEEEREALSTVLGTLVDDLRAIDQRNRDASGDVHAHIFTYEPSEAVSLQEALGRHLEDARISRALLEAVRIFPPEQTVPEPEYRGVHHLPATALRSVFEQVYAVPTRVAYDLRGVTSALESAGVPARFTYRPDDEFARRFSSRLNIDVCRALRDRPEVVPRVQADVVSRLRAVDALIDWLLEENARAPEPFLRLKKRPFRFQSDFHPLKASDLDALQAYAILANRAGLLSTLVSLAQPTRQRRDSFRTFANLTLRTTSRGNSSVRMIFEVPVESRRAELGRSDMGLVLTDGSPDILLNPAMWRDFSVDLESVDTSRLTVRMNRRAFDSPSFSAVRAATASDGWFIDQTFVDATSSRSIDFLRHLANADGT